ncbi:MAG: ComEC family competence protein [Flavobacteriales bacterium]|nr:ComEC family competence protein [Flavobacteriales bacterium]
MLFWSSFPFVRLTISFVLGILLGHFLEAKYNLFYVSFSFCCFLVLLLLSHFYNKQYQSQWLNGVLISSLICCLGFSHFSLSKENHMPPKLEAGSLISWIGRVESMQRNASLIKSFIVNVDKIECGGGWEDVSFNVLVYNKDTSLRIYPSDMIAALSKLREIESAKNPFQFDYKNYLSNKNVYYVFYEGNFAIDSSGISIYKLGSQLREYVEKIYRSPNLGREELGVLVALTLGDKSQIDIGNKKAFAGAGAMHLLAVSGLHVGIVFLLFNTLLQKLPNTRAFIVFRGVLLVGIVWGFALVTGFSPSVQRAGWMFSFVILAPLFRRNINVINSISLSAFILMLINPSALFEVGFQLSYSAVLGIVLIHPIVYRWIIVEDYLLDKLWSLLVVSLAAQLATLPLTLFYFHQFPNYFLLTNAIVIPLAFGIVFCAIIVLVVVSAFGWHFYLGELLDIQLSILNYCVSQITRLPHAVSNNLWIHPCSAFLIMSSIIFLIEYLYRINKKYLFGFLTSILSCLLLETYVDVNQLSKKQMTFYVTNKGAVFSHVVGLKGEVFYVNNENGINDRIVKDHFGAMGVELIMSHKLNARDAEQLVGIGDYSILISGNNETSNALCSDIKNFRNQKNFQLSQSIISSLTFLKNEEEILSLQKDDGLVQKCSFWLKY